MIVQLIQQHLTLPSKLWDGQVLQKINSIELNQSPWYSMQGILFFRYTFFTQLLVCIFNNIIHIKTDHLTQDKNWVENRVSYFHPSHPSYLPHYARPNKRASLNPQHMNSVGAILRAHHTNFINQRHVMYTKP